MRILDASTPWRLALAATFVALVAGPGAARAQSNGQNHADWALADRFSQQALKDVVFSTSVQPHWLGKTDSMWYNWKDHNGSTFYLVVPPLKLKRPLFDNAKLAAQLSELAHRPYDALNLPFTTIVFTKDHKRFRFNADSIRYEWNLTTQALKSLGKAPRGGKPAPDEEVEQQRNRFRRYGYGRFGAGRDFHNYSPDSSHFAFARDNNLFVVDVASGDTTQLSHDGTPKFSFGRRDTTAERLRMAQQGREGGRLPPDARDPRVRPFVVWSPDSKAFAVTRNDQRKVGDLWVIDALAQPRPRLYSYSYAMPGEKNVPQQDLYVWHVGDTTLTPVNVAKWKDQRLFSIHFDTGSNTLRLIRRDRLQRNLELIEVDLASGAIKTLISESIKHANLEFQNVRYTKRGGDIIWFSERSGWGHYYLYSNDGKYIRPLTSGAWRADDIVSVDTLGGVIYFSGYGREPGENVYYRHLYRVNDNGTGLKLLNPGDYMHVSEMSPTNKYFVDNYSRVETPTKTVIRDAMGRVVMNLEEADVSRLTAIGWKPPEEFTVKAADGVTDIYGNLWKPFDFDSTKKYPIIANVYPGPQTESVMTDFRPVNTPQELAQLGFIVIQIGNRGGSPLRSAAYHSFGYFNLRDYALADKKAGIEQLAARHPWIDLNRVGIYGHSGGGFLTGAAMMLPPYNEFFKVGWSESGNHDNNIYNQNWSEENHGLKLVPMHADSGRGRRGRMANRRDGSSPTDSATAQDSMRFEIHVPTNEALAKNLKGNLMLTTGDLDNNVSMDNTLRLAAALIKADKRFDFMILPGRPHGYGIDEGYDVKRMLEYFAEHLLGDHYGTEGATFDH